MNMFRAIGLAAVAALIGIPDLSQADEVVVDDYTLVSSTRISRTVYEYTYKGIVRNWSADDLAIRATLTSTASNITVMQGNLDFGDVAEGAAMQSTGTFVVRVDRSRPFDTDALLWTVTATALPATTYELIDDALATGALDTETALVYKVYFEFGDSRLPAQYRGRDNRYEATAFEEAVASYDTLSPATQALLRPFLLPPDDPASWYRARFPLPAATAGASAAVAPSVATTFAATATMGCEPIFDPRTGELVQGTVLTADGKVCITYFASFDGDAATAATLATEINNKIWPTMTGLMREPPLDANGHLNVHLVSATNMTTFYTQQPGTDTLGLATICSRGVPHVYLNRDKKQEIVQTAAHEITHAITASYNRSAACGDARWLNEATASWAEHHVYPCDKTEHGFARHLLSQPSEPLESTSGLHPYGAYLWVLYMTDVKGAVDCAPGARTGDASYVPRVWTALDYLDSLHAVDIAITTSGGLTKRWHDFALHNWNRDQRAHKPYTNYLDADRLLTQAKEAQGGNPVRVNLDGGVAKVYRMAHTVRHLGATYWHFDLERDTTIRRVRLWHPYAPSDKVKIQAIVRTDRGWQEAADWTSFQHKTLCRDKADENFRELVIVISNSEFEDTTFEAKDTGDFTKLQVSTLGCSNWKGSATGSFTSSTIPGDVFNFNSSTNAQGVRFEKSFESWLDDSHEIWYKSKAGNVTWHYDARYGVAPFICTGDFNGSYSVANATEGEVTLTFGIDGKPLYNIVGVMAPAPAGSITFDAGSYLLTCPEPDLKPGALGIDLVWTWVLASDGTNYPGIHDTDGGIFEGELRGASVMPSSVGGLQTFQWTLTKDGTFVDAAP